jgi:hypothetical protein
MTNKFSGRKEDGGRRKEKGVRSEETSKDVERRLSGMEETGSENQSSYTSTNKEAVTQCKQGQDH